MDDKLLQEVFEFCSTCSSENQKTLAEAIASPQARSFVFEAVAQTRTTPRDEREDKVARVATFALGLFPVAP